jgi:hypothetical protein
VAAIVIDGHNVDDGALLAMPALELACLPAADSLTQTAKASAHFEAEAEKMAVPLGRLSFILLERDPARSLTDPPPRLCRNIASRTPLKAPLFREKEPAARWLVRRMRANVVVDTAAVLDAALAQQLTASAHPRVVLDPHGALVAVAVPVGAPP